jgi:hypothetical protein
VGKSHDYSMLKEEFPPQKSWFINHEIQLDLGFIGFDKDYQCKKLRLPYRRKKQQELNAQEQEHNRDISKERIRIEHSIGGIKRFRILSERTRIRDYDLYDDILGVCAGLWNFYLTR